MNENNFNQLKWRCRRGMLEIDVMLQRYLDQKYREADKQERQLFLKLTELEDSELLRLLMGQSAPVEEPLCKLVEKIRAIKHL